MKVKSFSIPLLAIMLILSIIMLLSFTTIVAKPISPNPAQASWFNGTIWGTNLRFENSDNVLTISEIWFGVGKSEQKLAAPPDPPAGLIVEFLDNLGNNYLYWVKAAEAEPASYTWSVQFRKVKNTDPRGGKVSSTMENIDTRFVPQDYSVVLENTDLGIHINLRAGSDNVTGTNIRLAPILAALYADNAVNIQSIDNLDPLIGKPGDNLRLRVFVKNTGRYTDNYTVSAGGSLDPTILNLAPGNTDNVILTTILPNGTENIVITAAGNYATDQDYVTAMGQTLTLHAPISINGNSQFTIGNGVTSGSGIVGNPYIIENWVISASSTYGIRIRNTTAYFIVRNCLVENGGATYPGIRIENTINGTINNNICDNDKYGIFLYNSANYENIYNNTCYNNNIGIYLTTSCEYDNLTFNICLGNSTEGIYLYSSSHDSLSNNVCSNTLNGIELDTSSNHNTITGNVCLSNSNTGIDLYTNSYNTLTGNTCDNNYYGIDTSHSNHNTITGNTCSNNDKGIALYNSSSNSTLTGNTCDNNTEEGIELKRSSNGVISGNTCSSDKYGIGVYTSDNTLISNNYADDSILGIYIVSSSYYNLIGNSCSGNSSYGIYLTGSDNYNLLDGNTCSNNANGIGLDDSCAHGTISNNICSNNSVYGINLYYSTYNTLTGNTCNADSYGINLSHSPHNDIIGNTCDNNLQRGIALYNSSGNSTIENNTCEYNYNGISLSNSSNSTLYNNTCFGNARHGITLAYAADNNILTFNTCLNNDYGIRLTGSSNNTIALNYLLTNTDNNAYDDGTNAWDNGSAGNYWSDWQPDNITRWDNNYDGVVDNVRYILGGSNVDHYPLRIG